MEYTFYCANRSHHILFFLVTMDEVTVFDLFDTSNFAVLWYGGIERPPQFYFKLTGEEFMPMFGVYLHKSLFISLYYKLHRL